MASPPSPDGLQLRSKPTISARLNRKALFVLVGALVAIALFVMTSIAHPNTAAKANGAEQSRSRIVSAVGAGAEITDAVPANMPRLAAPLPEVPPLLPVAGQAGPARQGPPTAQDQELAQAMRSETALKFAAGDTPPPAPDYSG